MRETETPEYKDFGRAVDAAVRPTIREKSRYVPHAPQEQFIVPLLGREIESAIELYATPPRGRAKAVDIGCGGQPFRARLQDIGYSYCGVDVNPSPGVNVDVACGADEPLPEELLVRGPFDFLLCTEVIEHVADWQAAFANFALLLAPGGRALITAPHFYQLHEEPYDFWRPTLHAINYHARRAALEPLVLKPAGDGWDIIGTALANCFFVPSRRRLPERMLAKTMRGASRLLFRALRSGQLQSRVRAEGPLYLSNVAVLEKQ
jgi:SAM-dependent methyltransferase